MSRITRHRRFVIVAMLALAVVAGGASYFCLADGTGSPVGPYQAEGIAPTPKLGEAPAATPLTLVDEDYMPPVDQHWISPGTVAIGNFYPGARAEWSLTVHNGNTEPTEFAISAQQPQRTKAGYVAVPIDSLDWVIISEPRPVLAARETRDVLIAIEMPDDAIAPEHWELWVVCKPDAGGFVQVQFASRWLVDMRS